MLEKSCKKFMLFREANELQQWINEKEAALTNEEVGADLEQVEVLQKKFDDFQKVCCNLCANSSYLSIAEKHQPSSVGVPFCATHNLQLSRIFVVGWKNMFLFSAVEHFTRYIEVVLCFKMPIGF